MFALSDEQRDFQACARELAQNVIAPRAAEIDCSEQYPWSNVEALREAGKLGQITVVGFDDDPITLGGVKEGTIAGTVVQQPYLWAYQGMKLMAAYLKGDKSGIPANKLIIIPTKIIGKDDVDAYAANLKAMAGN